MISANKSMRELILSKELSNFNQSAQFKFNSGYLIESLDHFINIYRALTDDNHRILQCVTLVNVIIYLGWKFAPNLLMDQNFLLQDKNLRVGRWWNYLSCSFSHKDLWHLGGNIAAFSIFGPPSFDYLGTPKFVVLVIIAGVLSSIASELWRKSPATISRDKTIGSLGFSGINSALFVIYAKSKPDEHLILSRRVMTAPRALSVAIFGDVFGLWGTSKWGPFKNSRIGHAAHLGGYLSGYLMIQLCEIVRYINLAIHTAFSNHLHANSWHHYKHPRSFQSGNLNRKHEKSIHAPEYLTALALGSLIASAIAAFSAMKSRRKRRPQHALKALFQKILKLVT